MHRLKTVDSSISLSISQVEVISRGPQLRGTDTGQQKNSCSFHYPFDQGASHPIRIDLFTFRPGIVSRIESVVGANLGLMLGCMSTELDTHI